MKNQDKEAPDAAGKDYTEDNGILIPDSDETRDERGLLKGVDYKFREDGTVDWRAMIPDEFLYPNKEWFERRKEPVPKSIEGLDDKQLLLMLGGIKHVARLRGYRYVDYDFAPHSTPEHVAVKCTIQFIGNFETDGETVYFSSLANATIDNLSDFVMKFPETIAENRSFVRCVRNFLNINIVGDDEIDKGLEAIISDSPNKANQPSDILEKVVKKTLGIEKFDEFKDKLRELYKQKKYKPRVKAEDIAKWEDYTDIPKAEARNIVGTLNSLK